MERLRVEVLRLCEALGLGFDGATVACAGLPIVIAMTEKSVRVALAGWSQEFAVGSGETSDDEAEVDAALDLIGAALFGEVRVVVGSANGRAHRWTLELLEGAAWTAVRACGSRIWNPLARRTSAVLVNGYARPPGYDAIVVPAPTSAPWLGRAGFAGRREEATAVALVIDGVLDLHSHSPKDVKKLVLAYLEQCRARGILAVRIIHGKGVGNLRRTVHALLERHPHVTGFRLGGHGEGSWGATLVDLAPP
jgi:hypothetical protein